MTDTAAPATADADTAAEDVADDQHADTDTDTDADTGTGADVDDDADDGAEGDQDGDDDGGKDARDAKRYRRRAQAAERERDALAAQLAAERQSAVDAIATAAGVDPRLLVAAGHTVDTLVDAETGSLDRAKVTEAVETVAREFRVSRGPQVNRQQGAQSAGSGVAASWGDAFRGR